MAGRGGRRRASTSSTADSTTRRPAEPCHAASTQPSRKPHSTATKIYDAQRWPITAQEPQRKQQQTPPQPRKGTVHPESNTRPTDPPLRPRERFRAQPPSELVGESPPPWQQKRPRRPRHTPRELRSHQPQPDPCPQQRHRPNEHHRRLQPNPCQHPSRRHRPQRRTATRAPTHVRAHSDRCSPNAPTNDSSRTSSRRLTATPSPKPRHAATPNADARTTSGNNRGRDH